MLNFKIMCQDHEKTHKTREKEPNTHKITPRFIMENLKEKETLL